MDSGNAALSNSEIANRLMTLSQLLPANKENFYKRKAYRRAAIQLRSMSESIEDLVRDNADLTQFPGIGPGIRNAIEEIVRSGTLRKLEILRSQSPDPLLDISRYPRLDPKRVLRIFKKLHIASISSLKEKLESGEIANVLGLRMAQHVQQGLSETHALLLHQADRLCSTVQDFLIDKCKVKRAEPVGSIRRRTELIEELSFLIETDDFPSIISKIERFGGRSTLLHSDHRSARFALSSEIFLDIRVASEEDWGQALIESTGSRRHLRKLGAATGGLKALIQSKGPFATEADFYRAGGLAWIDPELREGYDEVQRAAEGRLPVLVSLTDLRGELHAHTLSSDGTASILDMAEGAASVRYEYIGITDHSQSLKIANGVPADELWKQIRFIDRLNEKSSAVRILKSAEVDILADGSLDYPDDLLKELDYTVCSIHSRFGQNKLQQTERLLRAMDNRYFNILGHATGRLLLKRPGYEIDIERLATHARQAGCFFEINCSPDRLDLSAENARIVSAAGVKVAISTDAHAIGDFRTARYGVDQARRAGIEKSSVLNSLPWNSLCLLFKR